MQSVFIDWITISQVYVQELPIIADGFLVGFDANGIETFARASPSRFRGSYETSISVKSDGHRVVVSGNPGRFNRQDNLFSYDIERTVQRASRILESLGLPPLSVGERVPESTAWTGARIHRLDLTCNYATGSMSKARAFVRWLQGQSCKRISKGQVGDESVWWANSREMLKAYNKALEMEQRGILETDERVEWARKNGVVRVELELKRRLLAELGLNWLGAIDMEKITKIFKDRTEVIRRADASGDVDILEAIPTRSRAIAAAWLQGQDAKALCSRASYFRHLKTLRDHGLDISQSRDVTRLAVKVVEIYLEALGAPDWYWPKYGEAA